MGLLYLSVVLITHDEVAKRSFPQYKKRGKIHMCLMKRIYRTRDDGMKQLDVASLRKNITFSITLTMLVLIIVTAAATTLIQKHQQDQRKQEYDVLVHQNIEAAIKLYIRNYTNRIERLTKTTRLPELLKQKDREGLYRLLKPKWELMKEGEPYLAIMHLHLPDGTSFLRLHQPELFGDQLTQMRPMIKEIHRSHQMLSGYETGKQGIFYRTVLPIFDAQQTYIGAFELGLDINFILRTIYEINGFRGLIFIKEEERKDFVSPSDMIIDGYRLQSYLTPDFKAILNRLRVSADRLKDDIEITVGEKRYFMHVVTLNDFKHQAAIKILFFQDISKTGILSTYMLVWISIATVIIFALLILFIYRRIGTYQDDVTEVYRKQIEKFDESENRFQLLYEKAPIAYQSMDDNQNILIVNTQWCEELGLTKEEAIGKDFSDFLAPEYRKDFAEFFTRAKAAGGCKNRELEMLRKDGTRITVSLKGKAVYDEAGSFSQMHCTFVNITKQKSLQEALQFSQNYLQNIFDSVPNIMVTTDGKLIDNATPLMLEFFGYRTLNAFKSEHDCICDFFEEGSGLLQPVMEGVDWLEYMLSRPDKIHKAHMRHKGRQHHFIVHVKPIALDQKKRSVVSFTDVTEFDELRERLEYAVNSTSDGLWDWDIKTGTVYFSQRWKAMLGYKDEEFPNLFQAWREHVHPDDIDKVLHDVEMSRLSPGSPLKNIHRLRHKDGHWLWVLERGQAICDENGKAVRMVGFQTDISELKALENELRASKQQFDLFMQHMPYPVTIKDESYRPVYINPVKEASLKPTIENVDKKAVQQINALCDRAVREGKAEEVIKYEQNGRSYICRAVAFAIPQDNGKVYTGVIYIDISKQYRDEHEIRKLQQVLEKSPVSIIITDVDGNMEYVNPWFCHLTGYPQEEAIGQNPKILQSGYTSQNEYKMMWNTISKGEVWSGIFKNLKKNGEAYWESAIIAPIRNERGKIVNYIGIKQEFTEQIRLEEKLKKQQAKTLELGNILEDSRNEIYIFDRNSLKFLYANKGARNNIGYSLKELLELTPLDIKPEMRAEKFSKLVKPLERNKAEKIFFSTYNQRKNGTAYPVDVYLQQIVFEGINAYMSIVIDTTEREKIRKKLRDQEEIMIAQSRHAAMGEMIGMIAHQWRQPITVIAMGANNMLVDIELDELKEESIKEQAQSILRQTDYLSRTIDDFRNFFRPDKEKEEVNLEDVMNEAEQIIGKSLEHNAVTLSIRDENGYKVKTYSRELLQVFINLLKNAKEALVEKREKDRHIDVIISDDTNNVITTVCDNGGGIDEEIIDKIFDPYFTTKDEKTGTGLGLYMSKTIVEKHLNGTIEVYNTKEGACFKVVIPLAEKQPHES